MRWTRNKLKEIGKKKGSLYIIGSARKYVIMFEDGSLFIGGMDLTVAKQLKVKDAVKYLGL